MLWVGALQEFCTNDLFEPQVTTRIYCWVRSSSCRPPHELAPQLLSAEAGFNLQISAKSSCLEAWLALQSHSAAWQQQQVSRKEAYKTIKSNMIISHHYKVPTANPSHGIYNVV